MRDKDFANGEYYHIYNHAIEGRDLFTDKYDMDRFFQGLIEFNSVNPIGSIYENSFIKKLGNETTKLKQDEKLVEIVAYCINPNHYHFILGQVSDGGISEFMKRIGGYTRYFNNRHKRKGTLFRGVFKSKHIDGDEYFLHLSSYINLNDRVHGLDKINELGNETTKLIKSKSSWDEYIGKTHGICNKDIVLEQLGGSGNYKEFAENTIGDMIERKEYVDFVH